jgi:DNA-directed RNA polymerases I, II, and III subunit RPABC2
MDDTYFGDDNDFDQESSSGEEEENELEEDDNDEIDQYGGEGEGEGEGEMEIEDEDEDEIKEVTQLEEQPLSIKNPNTDLQFITDEDDDDMDDPDGDEYLQKFNKEIKENYIMNFHPESKLQNYDEVISMSKVVRDENGRIIDPLHKTVPYLTKYEKARILGQRAKQINAGSTAFVKVPENVIDGYVIAELELQQKRIPFIIRRPLPNGGSEYWNVKDLENIGF